MLDRMRRHKNWLKWSLALVVLTFIIFYIPDFLRSSANGTATGAAPGAAVAEVNGEEITVDEFHRVYQAQLQAYRAQAGGSLNDQLLKQLGIDRQILQQLIEERAQVAEAQRVGLTVNDAEVRERIITLPSFQENGHFIGEARYRQLLQFQNPPMTTAQFEDRVRRALLVEKLRNALTAWMTISDREVEEEYRRRNEKVKLSVAVIPSSKYAADVAVSDAEISAHFEKNKESYRKPEQRKVRFLMLDAQSVKSDITISEQDIERAYRDRSDQFSTPEQVRASHILLKTEGKDEAAVKKKADELAAKARGGADFAKLAAEFSEDEGSAKQGGDLDYFGRGRMVPEFEKAAFGAEPGTITDPVKTQFGYHIIKVVDKKAGGTRPLSEVRQQLTDQLTNERAQQRISTITAEIAGELKTPADLDRVAKARGLKVQESAFFSRTDPIAGLGFSPTASAVAFELKKGAVSEPVRVASGQVFMSLVDSKASYIPKLDEVKDQVREDVKQQKASEVAKTKAMELLPALKSAADFTAAAKVAGIEAKSTDLVARGSAIPDVGVSPAVDRAAFGLPVGAVSEPIVTDQGVAIVKVLERSEITPAEIGSARETLRADLLNERRNRFFSAYMDKAKARMRIEIFQDTLQRATA
jgi:peptidyl-prolyl cis-trans isomerase D